MKTGDKVRFLNTIGGGVIKGFQGKDIVLVEDEDGFEIPVLIRECVVISPINDAQVRQSAKPTIEVQRTTTQKIEQEYKIQETKEGELISVFLAYLPNDIKNLSSTDFECYLINDSNYYLSFNYMNRADNGWTSRCTDVIEPNTKIYIDEFSKAELNDMEHLCIQLIAYKKDKSFALKNTASIELKIDTVKFYKLHSFKENDYFEENALIYPVIRKDLPEKELSISAEELERAILEKQIQPRPRKQAIERADKKNIIEIDLHITELLDNTNGLSSADMLEYQLRKFDEVMDENKQHKGQKIVFIHGKGDGVLKNAILKELRTKYKTAYFQDASFREYGYGATMVTIK